MHSEQQVSNVSPEITSCSVIYLCTKCLNFCFIFSSRNTCFSNVNSKYKNELKGAKAAIRTEIGACTANNIIYNIEQLIAICVVESSG